MKSTKIGIYLLILLSFLTIDIYAQQDGTLDTSFGDNGIVVTDIPGKYINDSKLDKDNNLFFFWETYSGSFEGFTNHLSKFKEDGSPDLSFGNNGTVELLSVLEDSSRVKYYQYDFVSNGKILLSKRIDKETLIHYDDAPDSMYLISQCSVIRLNGDGSIDNQFGNNGELNIYSYEGIVPADIYPFYLSSILKILVRSDDSFLVRWKPNSLPSEDGNYYSEVRCYDYNGELNTDWGNNGSISLEIHPPDYHPYDYEIIDSSDNYYFNREYSKITKYTQNGNVDYSFGNSGVIVIDSSYFGNAEPYYEDWGVDNKGKLHFYFTDYENYDIYLIRFNENGFPDSTFAGNGINTVSISEQALYTETSRMLLMPDGNIILNYTDGANMWPENYILKIAKFNSDGTYNQTFGGTGIISVNIGEQGFENKNLLLRNTDYKILLFNKGLSEDSSLVSFMRYNNSHSYSSLHVLGDVSGSWDVDTVYVDGDITIPEGEILTINPGTVVYFTGWYKFDVHGRLIAEGTDNKNIIFNAPDDVLWHGMRFYHTDDNNQPVSKIKHCQFTKAGGGTYGNPGWPALYFVHSTVSVSDSKIFQSGSELNYSMSLINSGGNVSNTEFNNVSGLYIDSSSTVSIHNCHIDSCGISIYNNSSPVIDSCVIENSWNGGSVVGIYGYNASPEISNTLIKNNGGGVYFTNSNPVLTFVTIENNQTYANGGGGYFDKSNVVLTNVIVKGNSGGQHGGGLYFTAPNSGNNYSATLKNCLIVQNTISNSSNSGSGVVFAGKYTGNLTNCSIADNVASSWAGVMTDSYSQVYLNNSIVWNNGNNLEYQAGGLYTYSIVQGNYVGQDTSTTNLENVDPLFRDAANGDYHLQSTGCGYSSSSQAIDAGSPAINDFVIDCASAGLGTQASDMGAYGGADNWWDQTNSNPPCYFSGEVSGIWDCDTIHVNGDVLVPQDETLEITDNVKKVIITGPYQIKVEGTLLAHGPEDGFDGLNGDYISFTGSSWHGIYFNNLNGAGQQTSVIENCRFDNADKMDMTYQGGGAIAIYNSDSVIVKNSVFHGNKAKYGGAVYIENSNPVIENCYFANNGYYTNSVQTEAGGALFIKDASPLLYKLQIVENKSISGGGAIEFINSSPVVRNVLAVKNLTGGLGGAFYLANGASPEFVNATVSDNNANSGGAFYLNQNSNPIVINSIIYGDTKPEIYLGGGTPVVTYSLVDEASSESWFGTGCLDTDPYFKMTIGNYYYLKSTDCGDGVNSSAIDAGYPDSLDAVLDCEQGLGTLQADMGYYGGRYSDEVTGINDNELNNTSAEYSLMQNYPNPFNLSTTINYSLPFVFSNFTDVNGEKSQSVSSSGRNGSVNVSLEVYDMLGRKVATLVNKKQTPGKYSIQFDASKLTPGTYFYRLSAGGFTATKKMILMK